MGKKELVALLSLSSWCLLIVVWLFFAVPWVCLQFVIVVFPDHTLTYYYQRIPYISLIPKTWADQVGVRAGSPDPL